MGNEHPEVARLLNNLALVLRDQGKLAEAETMFREALAMRIKMLGTEHPDVGASIKNLTDLLVSEGKLDDLKSLDVANGTNAAAVVIQDNLGWRYQNGLGVDRNFSEAVKWYRKAAEQRDSSAQMHLGWMYEMGMGVAKDYAEALKMYLAAGESADADLLNELAWRLATSDTVEMRDGTNAVRFAEKAVTASPQNPGFLNTLAAAYAETQQFNRAATTEQEAIGILPSDQDKNGYESRLKLYQAHKSYRAQENP